MRSKIIFFLILILSFVIVHDTVLNIIDPGQNHIALEEHMENCQNDTTQFNDLHHLHSMFHFLALIPFDISNIPTLKSNESITTTLLEYFYIDKEHRHRPPITL